MSGQKLKYLSILLENLPDTLPDCGDTSEYYEALYPFDLDQNHIFRIGDEVQAFCYVLNTIFKADNEWAIIERGWCIRKVVTVLEYCSISNCSAKGVTCDPLDELASPARCNVTQDMAQNSANR